MDQNIAGYQFDDVFIDLKNRQVRRDNQVYPLNAKYFDVLAFLVSHHSRLISKDQLFDNIWNDVIVTDSALSQCIKDIRKVLGDDAKNPRYIKTYPKHGFMFIKEPDILPVAEESVSKPHTESAISRRPYKFLDYYTESDSEFFFGRESEVQTICSQILSHRSLVLYGRSGVGKSSIAHAGVIPVLRKLGHTAFIIRGFHDPVEQIMTVLMKNYNKQEMDTDPGMALEGLSLPAGTSVIFVLDQFEEFFTLLPAGKREKFIRFLEQISQKDNLDFKLLFVLREDLLADMSEFKPVLPEIFHNEYRLQRFDRNHAEQAIIEPARKVGCEFEPDLVQAILQDLADEDYVDPPQLQIICDALYDYRDDSSRITLNIYRKLGGAYQILSQYLERVIQRYHSGDLEMAKIILIGLISGNDQRLLLPLSELETEVLSEFGDRNKVRKLIEDLAAARVIRYRRQDGQTRVELTHDFLIPEISRWQSAETLAMKRAQAVIDRAAENYQVHQLLLDDDTLDLIIPIGESIRLSGDEADLLVRSMLNRGRTIPEWLARKSPSLFHLIKEASESEYANSRISAAETAALIPLDRIKPILQKQALWDEDLMVRKAASIVLAEKNGDASIRKILAVDREPRPGIIRQAISLAFIRDHNKRLFKLRMLPPLVAFLVLSGLMWVRLRREKLEILKNTLGGAFGASLSGLLVGLVLGVLLVVFRQTPVFESTTLILVLASLGCIAGLMAGIGISLGMSAMQSIGYRHSPYWSVIGAVLGGALIGGILHIIGVDTFQALFGQQLSEIAGAYEGAIIGLGLSLGYLAGGVTNHQRMWIRIAMASIGTMLAAIILTLIQGNLFSASIETIAKSFVNSQINLQPLAKVFGESHYGQLSRLILGAAEGFLFGGGLTFGLEISRKYR
jgi:DNA-binding winged helix-turn-helix (wHTH) protein